MSREFADDPAIEAALADYDPLEAATAMKGFDDPVPFLRVTSDELTAKRRAAKPGINQRS